ncbi:MAG: cadmium-translocating P-type ATPase [Oscillospiraceae bacterium]|nr:cadmium-translocating P-type ATPase [Oscillospiraceae bacterium]
MAKEHKQSCSCGCSHEHKHEHKQEGESCGCAMCQLENLTGLAEDCEDKACDCHHHHEQEQCSCGHHHHHEHHHEHGSCSCGCGHEHKHEHKHEGESCGCAMCQLENVKLSEEAAPAASAAPSKEKKAFVLPELSMPLMALIAVAAVLLSAVPGLSLLKGLFYLIPTLLWGKLLFTRGWKAAKRRQLDEHVLTSIAVIAAFLIGEYFEAMMVVILFAIGDWLEVKAVQRSRKDIAAVVNIRPQKANLILPNGEVQNILSKKLRIGDKIQIKVGERVPVDSVILEGQSTMDRSAITGESIAVGVQPGDRVLSGEVNLSAVLTCRCETTYDNSTASKIIQLVEESSAQKGETEKFITRFAKYYTPAVLVMAILTVIVPPLLGWGSFRMWLSRALVFLVASCPCALVISVPLAFFSGVGAMSKQGVLLKGTKFIEPLANAKYIVCDKTGTITTGELQVSKVEQFSDSYDMKAVSALAEKYSDHPVAQAICRAFGSGMEAEVKQVEEFAGKGVSLLMDGKKVLCGSARLMKEQGIAMDSVPEANVYTAVDGQLIGCVMLSDVPRSDAASTMKQLKAQGVERTVMLTGDSAISAAVVKEQVGMDEMHCALLPQDKSRLMKELKQKGKTTVFVGDGINDAPVLAAADIGFAMGLGTDAAIESADAVLMSDSLSALPKVMETAKRTVSIVKANIVFILISKAAVLLLGLTGYAPMWLAVVADVGVSVLTVLNAVRILNVKN